MGDNDDRDNPERPKEGTDFSKLTGLSNGGPAMEAMRRASDEIATMKEAMRAVDAMKTALGPAHEIQERMRALAAQFRPDSGIGKIVEQLRDQQRTIDAMRLTSPYPESPRVPELHNVPPNPMDETNKRLERIEQRFERMLDVAANGAQIATDLQAHAAQFLVKFEDAASENSRSAARAIRLGAIAVAIALAMPLAQILYTELWRVPKDTASMESAIKDMQSEIATLRLAQIEAADLIGTALARSDLQMVEALREVARNVSTSAPVLGEPPSPAE